MYVLSLYCYEYIQFWIYSLLFYSLKCFYFSKSHGDRVLTVGVGVVALGAFSDASAHGRHPYDGRATLEILGIEGLVRSGGMCPSGPF